LQPGEWRPRVRAHSALKDAITGQQGDKRLRVV